MCIFFLIVFVIGSIFHLFFLEPTRVIGDSMQNLFSDQEIIFIDKLSLLFTKPHRGQVVSLFYDNEKMLYVKRIIGLPGETIELIDGHVYIIFADGRKQKLDEKYLPEGEITRSASGELDAVFPEIEPHHYFVMGDNRDHSIDSRNYGMVNRRRIIGVVRQLPFRSLLLFNLDRCPYGNEFAK